LLFSRFARKFASFPASNDATQNILAYFSILNDKIDREFIESKVWNRLTDPKEDDETVLMFFDLKSWSER